MNKLRARLDRWGTPSAVVVWAVTMAVCLVSILIPGFTRASGGEAGGGVYAVRSQLLMEAMDRVGVGDPGSAAAVWAEGLMDRSAAMQYSVMTSDLKAEYAARLEQTFPNWVTGVSSPWIDRYEILETTPQGDDRARIALKFITATSTGPAGSHRAALTIERDGAFWRISHIEAGEGLDAYTGF